MDKGITRVFVDGGITNVEQVTIYFTDKEDIMVQAPQSVLMDFTFPVLCPDTITMREKIAENMKCLRDFN